LPLASLIVTYDVTQDAKELLAEVRELNFALDESNEATEHMTTELSAVQVLFLCLLQTDICPLQISTDSVLTQKEAISDIEA